MDPPVVKNSGDMHNLITPQHFTTTKHEIMVLRAFQPLTESTHLAHKICGVNTQMAEKVL